MDLCLAFGRFFTLAHFFYSLPALIDRLAKDPPPKVRRECAVCLRLVEGPGKPELWRKLAMAHEAGDRWSLEALGIAADGDWDTCLSVWLKEDGGDWNSAAGREIIWRSRAINSAQLIARILKDPKTTEEDKPRYFRALDFQTAGQKEVLSFTAPKEPGQYDYVCTFPCHWRLMKGVLTVVGAE